MLSHDLFCIDQEQILQDRYPIHTLLPATSKPTSLPCPSLVALRPRAASLVGRGGLRRKYHFSTVYVYEQLG